MRNPDSEGLDPIIESLILAMSKDISPSYKGPIMTQESVSRYELDAKTQAIEARMDTRIAHMESIVERAMEVSKEAKEEAKETRRHITIIAWTAAGVIVGAIAISTAWQIYAFTDLGTRIQSLSDRMYQVTQTLDKLPAEMRKTK